MLKYFLTLFLFPSLLFAFNQKEKGLIWGSIYGDAFGGPYEFQKISPHPLIKLNRKLSKKEWTALAKTVKLTAYKIKPHPYGIWRSNAPKGSITDDTRHKIILWDSYKINNKNLTAKLLANNYIRYYQKGGMYQKWLKEISHASYFLINPKHKDALPLERMYGGIPTLLGQLIFLPISILYSGKPTDAYLKTYELNYFDMGYAKDITSSIVASLSEALKEQGNWKQVKNSFFLIDPYQFKKSEYVKRILEEKVQLALDLVKKSKGIPLKLFKLLEEHLSAKTWWEAEVSLVVAISFLELAKAKPLAALALCREFGHDVDSYAQLVGAYLGALYGESIFDSQDLADVKKTVKAEFPKILQELY